MLYTRKKNDLSTQAGRKHTKTNESITIFTCFQTHTSTRLRSIVAEHQTFKHLQNLQTHTQKGDTESINRRTKKCPDITSGQFLRFWMFQQFCVFYVVMIFLKISLCFFSNANIIQIIDLNQIYIFFLRKKSRKRLRYLLLFMRNQQGNFIASIRIMQ